MEAIDVLSKAASMAHRGYRYLSRRRRDNKHITSVRTEYISEVTLTTGQATLNLSDVSADSVDLAELGDVYRWFRFKEIIIEFPAPTWSTAGLLAACFVPSVGTSYTSFANMEAPHVALISSNQTVPTRLSIPGKSLAGGLQWYLTNGTTSYQDVQGSILFQSHTSSSEEITFKVVAVCEFKELVDPTIIAMNLDTRLVLRKLTNQLRAAGHSKEYIRKRLKEASSERNAK